jgi:AcrR family transcriptional regulator
MGIVERREREKEALRARIVEAARDLLSEEGLDALSMRAIAERIEYSPATIYLYFRDKEELTSEVIREGFRRMHAVMMEELAALPETASGAEQYGATGRAYARFAVENTAFFRVMFELPSAARVNCPRRAQGPEETSFDRVVLSVEKGLQDGSIQGTNAQHIALIGWGLVHGLTSLYLSGHLVDDAPDQASFMRLVDEAIGKLGVGLRNGSTSPGN